MREQLQNSIVSKFFSLYIVISLLCLGISSANAQEKSAVEKGTDRKAKVNITFQPLFLLNNALKLDVEVRPVNQQFGVIGGVEIYDGRTDALYNQETKFDEDLIGEVGGAGINFAGVYQFDKQPNTGTFYFSPGVTFRKLDLTLTGLMFYAYQENNVEYITYGNAEKKYKINPLLVYGNFGYQYVRKFFVLDVYGGIGYKSLKKPLTFEGKELFQKGAYAYAHEGFILQFGFKFGFQF